MNESKLIIISADARWPASLWRRDILRRLPNILEQDIAVREIDPSEVGERRTEELFAEEESFRPIGEYIAEVEIAAEAEVAAEAVVAEAEVAAEAVVADDISDKAAKEAEKQELRVMFLYQGVADARAGAAASALKGLAAARRSERGEFRPITIQSTKTNLGWTVAELVGRILREEEMMVQAKQMHNVLAYVDTLTREHFTPETWREIHEAASEARYLYFTLDESDGAEVEAALARLNAALENAQLKIEGLETEEYVPNRTLEHILNRYSCRNFGPNPISDEQMEWLRKAALAAPTGMNLRRTHYSFVRDARLLERVNRACLARARETDNKELLRRIAGRHSSFLYNAPLVVFIAAPPGGADNVNAGIGVQTICLAAESLGLGSCILGLPVLAFERRDADELKEALGFPEEYEFVIAVAFGTKNIAGEAHKWRESQVKIIDPAPTP